MTEPAVIDPEVLTEELIDLRRQRLAVRRKRLEAVKSYGLMFYRPHPKQDAFHRAGGQFRKRMVRAGNRFGKSHMGCAEDCSWLLGERPWYPESDPARTAGIPRRAVKGLIITTDWPKVTEIWTNVHGDKPGKLWTMLPKDSVKFKRPGPEGSIEFLELMNGSTLTFETNTSFKNNPQGSESSDYDFIHIDEPCPQLMFNASARGLVDSGGSFWFTLTPLTEFWINDLFFPEDTGGQPRDDVWMTEGAIHDNPTLSAEAIADFASLLTEDEKQCRLFGRPLHLSGLVYKEFDWDRHVLKSKWPGWKDALSPPDHWSIYVQIDPHPRTPHCVLFLAVNPLGQHVYYYDLFIACPIPELVKEIRKILNGRQPIWVAADPLAFIETPRDDIYRSMADDFCDAGMPVERAPKNPSYGILEVKKRLTEENFIFFSPECRRTLWEIRRWCWNEEKNKPIDKDDHAMENLYRLEISNAVFIDYQNNFNVVVSEEIFDQANFDLESIDFSTSDI